MAYRYKRKKDYKPLIFSLIGSLVILCIIAGLMTWTLILKTRNEVKVDDFSTLKTQAVEEYTKIENSYNKYCSSSFSQYASDKAFTYKNDEGVAIILNGKVIGAGKTKIEALENAGSPNLSYTKLTKGKRKKAKTYIVVVLPSEDDSSFKLCEY